MTSDELTGATTPQSDDTPVESAENVESEAVPGQDVNVAQPEVAEEEPEVVPVSDESAADIEPEPAPDEVAAEDAAPEEASDTPDEPDEPAAAEAVETDEAAGTDGAVAIDEAVETNESGATDEIEKPARVRSPIAWWPFAIYAVLWISLAAATYFLLQGQQADVPAFRQDPYPYLLLAGLVLVLFGPVLSVSTWLVAWRKAGPGNRGGLFTKAMMRGAIITFLGVAAWYGTLNLVDVIRLGWI